MRQEGGYWVGTIPGCIRDVLIHTVRPAKELKYVLITSIDSCSNLRGLPTVQAVAKRGEIEGFLGEAPIMEGDHLGDLDKDHNLFNGFDEIWFFRDIPSVGLPRGISIAGPTRLDEMVPDGLIDWMRKAGCDLGLGDGIGLNFIAWDRAVAEAIAVPRKGRPPARSG
jgi:hypothetical protein